ncbi:hypothetical protein PV326_008126 [Microctonus aethiopoides]|uniref:Transmembrane protein n=1 Tax=Microctonus aethiopoides TaxID=144406 RepID=A0AA39C6Z2_9HYME|nr:hypothetical protein PV326_008126 [Microctonus aethiopoides]KAK0158615.1 hypothetical protein PV328_009593 [Microctonus aethiopoides]
MTIKSLFNWGGFGGETERPKLHNERWHRDGWDYKSHGHNHGYHKGGSKGGGSSAALSALALLAFLFLINVMQQSLNDNNSTAPMGPTTVLLRQDSSPIVLTSHEIDINSESREVKNFGDTGLIDSSQKKSNQIMNKNKNT